MPGDETDAARFAEAFTLFLERYREALPPAGGTVASPSTSSLPRTGAGAQAS